MVRSSVPIQIAILLMLAGWLTTNHFPPWVSWHSEAPFFLLAIAAAIWGVARSDLRAGIEMPLAVVLPLALAAVLVLQVMLSMIDWQGQVVVIALYLLLLIVGLTWGWREGRAELASATPVHCDAGVWLALALLMGAGASLAIALLQVFQLSDNMSFIAPLPYVRRPGANLAQPNHLATLTVMAMAGAIYLRFKAQISHRVLLVVLAFGALCVAVTESRTGLLAQLCLFGFLWARSPQGPDHRLRATALVAAAMAIGLFLAWPTVWANLAAGGSQGVGSLERLSQSGSDVRLLLWVQMLQASVQRPWLGWGFRDTAEAQNAVAHEAMSSLTITYSHNIVIDLLVWIGWPLTLMAIAFFAWWFVRRCWPATRLSLGWFGTALLIPFTVHSMLEFPHAYAYLLFPAVLGAGYVEACHAQRRKALYLPAWGSAPVVLALAVLGAWSVVDYLRAEEDFRVARFQLMRIGTPVEQPVPDLYVLDQLADMIASTRVPLKPELTTEQLALLRRAAVHFPWTATQYRYATALALNRQADEARRQMLVLRAQQGPKSYELLRAHLEAELIKRGLPPLGLAPLAP